MKRNTGPILVGIAVMLVVGVLTYGVLRTDAAPAPANEGEFIDGVRKDADSTPDSEEKLASLPGSSNPDLLPSIEVETASYDLGFIDNNKIAEGSVKIRNKGGAPLQITQVNTSCGCTKGKMKEDVIPPGGEGVLNVTVDPAKIPGFFSQKTLSIFSNDPKNSVIKVDVIARINAEIAWEPESLEFGKIAQGETLEKKVIVRQNTDEAFSLNEVTLSPRPEVFDLSFIERPKEEWKVADRKEWEVTAKLRPDSPVGNFPSRIRLGTDLKRLKQTNIPLTIEVGGVYSVNPNVVTLRSVEAGATIENVLLVDSQVPIELTKIEATNDNLKVTSHPGSKPNTIALDLAVAKNPADRLQRDTWKLTLKADGREYTESVRVLAIVKSADEAAAPAAPNTAAVPPAAPPAEETKPAAQTPAPTPPSQ
ncbi:MAG: DUF1573 domain-containing protein [Candidatus Hydrogenedentota bacterium]